MLYENQVSSHTTILFTNVFPFRNCWGNLIKLQMFQLLFGCQQVRVALAYTLRNARFLITIMTDCINYRRSCYNFGNFPMLIAALKDVTNNAGKRAFLSFNLYFHVIFMQGKHLSPSQCFILELRSRSL